MDIKSDTFKTTGKIVYEPKRNSGVPTKWWVVMEFYNDDLSRYLRWHLEKNWWEFDSGQKRKYHRPPHKSHITIIRGEEPKKNKNLWGKYLNGKILPVEITLELRKTRGFKSDHGDFRFVKAIFPEYNKIREKFGLPTETPEGISFKGHLTFARTYDNV